MPRRQTRRTCGFATTRGNRHKYLPQRFEYWHLARNFVRGHLYHPRYFPLPGAVESLNKDYSWLERQSILRLIRGILQEDARIISEYLRHPYPWDPFGGINIRARCDPRFYRRKVCECTDVRDCSQEYGNGDGLPLAGYPDGRLADFYELDIREAYDRWSRTGEFIPPERET